MWATFVRRCGVDRDLAALVHAHARLVEVELVAVRAPADRDEDAVVRLRLGRLLALERDLDALRRLASADATLVESMIAS